MKYQVWYTWTPYKGQYHAGESFQSAHFTNSSSVTEWIDTIKSQCKILRRRLLAITDIQSVQE